MAHVLLRGQALGISTIREQAALNLSERTHMNKTTPFPSSCHCSPATRGGRTGVLWRSARVDIQFAMQREEEMYTASYRGAAHVAVVSVFVLMYFVPASIARIARRKN